MRLKPNINPLLNFPTWICFHFLGEKHTHAHRIIIGVFVMGFGVGIAKIHTEYIIIHFVYDMCGYLIHGIGAVPIIEFLTHKTNEKSKEKEKIRETEEVS